MRNAPVSVPEGIVQHPTTFDVGAHKLIVKKINEGRWTVAVDERPLDASFQTQADAWEAGVREIHRLGGLTRS
jgi:hypothetical protein